MAEFQKICANCGYDLIAQPPMGKCPECGQVFNTRTGVGLKDTSPVTSGERIVRRFKTIFFAALGVLILGCSGCSLAFGSKRGFFTWLVIAVVVFLGALTSYVYERDDG